MLYGWVYTKVDISGRLVVLDNQEDEMISQVSCEILVELISRYALIGWLITPQSYVLCCRTMKTGCCNLDHLPASPFPAHEIRTGTARGTNRFCGEGDRPSHWRKLPFSCAAHHIRAFVRSAARSHPRHMIPEPRDFHTTPVSAPGAGPTLAPLSEPGGDEANGHLEANRKAD
jgi:hypothetical protein